MATCFKSSGVDILLGTGGAPEGVIAAAALRCIGGDMQGILEFRHDEEKERARRMGITDFNKIYSIEDLASGDVMFAATGVTNGDFLKGVHFFGGGCTTQSVIMRSKTKTIRYISAEHHFDYKPEY
jgi:fructose-1,6-bisphosphatase II